MNNRTILAFETLSKSKEIVRRIGENFYPTGTDWLLGFSGGKCCLALETGENDIDPSLCGKLDLILVKDTVLFPEEWAVIGEILTTNDLYVIYHYSSADGNRVNSKEIEKQDGLGKLLRGSITQSHLEGEFYFDELVQLLECVELSNEESKAKYGMLLHQLIIRRFPDQVLEVKLNLLHNCMDLSEAKRVILADMLKDEYKEAFETFQNGLTAENHLERLSAFRDTLLS